jgi:hypothetical protein
VAAVVAAFATVADVLRAVAAVVSAACSPWRSHHGFRGNNFLCLVDIHHSLSFALSFFANVIRMAFCGVSLNPCNVSFA